MSSLSLRIVRLAAAGVLVAASYGRAQLTTSIATRWSLPSSLTQDQAVEVLYREASGQAVSPSSLFEARKHLRTDGGVSFGGGVTASVVQKLLQARFAGDNAVRVRALPPILQWGDSTSYLDANGVQAIRIRGESLVAATLNSDPNLAATALFHFSVNEDWRACGSSNCLTPLSGTLHSNVDYQLAVPLKTVVPGEARSSELILAANYPGNVFTQTYPSADASRVLGVACDPLPSMTSFTSTDASPSFMRFDHTAARTDASQTNRIFCAFFANANGSLARFIYFAEGAIAGAPPSAARSATVNNPLDFQIFQ